MKGLATTASKIHQKQNLFRLGGVSEATEGGRSTVEARRGNGKGIGMEDAEGEQESSH